MPGIPTVEQAFSLPELLTAGESFLTNSVIEVMPLVRIEDRPIGDGAPGAVTGRFAALYRDIVALEVSGRDR